MKIRTATKSDIPFIHEIEKTCFNDPWSIDSLSSDLGSSLMLVYENDNNQIQGYANIKYLIDEGDLVRIAILPNFQGKGIGKLLLEKMIEESKKLGIKKIFLEVRTSNTRAYNLYIKEKFMQIGKRPNFYTNPREDAFLLEYEDSGN